MSSLRVACLFAVALAACSSAPGAATDGDAAVAPVDGTSDSADAGAAGDAGDAGAADASDASASCPAPALAAVLTFQLAHAAYPGSGHPDVAVHVPPGFDPCRQPSLVMFFHGFENCVMNAMGATDSVCTPGSPARVALHLAEQFDAANVNAILVAPELSFDADTGNPGNLDNPGEVRAMLSELLVDNLAPLLGVSVDVPDLDRIVVASHSGGYWATARTLAVGGLDVDEVELYDSLYGQDSTYSDWTTSDVSLFDPSALPARRFSMIWTTGGGTYALSEQLESNVESALSSAGLDSLLFFQEDTAPTPTDAELAQPFVFKHSGLSHYGVPLYYFERVLAASDIAPIP